MGGFVATGLVAIAQTVTPLLLAQLWKKNDIDMDVNNPWFSHAWKAMQATGVIGYGLQALAFFAALMFDLSIIERLGFFWIWAVHGAIGGLLGAITVISYFVVAVTQYESSNYSDTTEYWITGAVYAVAELLFAFIGVYFAYDTVMFLVAQEIKDICENYGALCSEYSILEKNDSGFIEADGTSLSHWVWA